MEIENFKLKEFYTQSKQLINEYIHLFQYLKPLITKKEVLHLKLKHVEFIKTNLYSDNDENLIKIISLVQKIKKKEVYEMPIIEFFRLILSVKKQIKQISDAEQSSLTPDEINIKWEMVGGSEKMRKFGIYNTLEHLANGDILKYKEILNLPYSEVFTVLLMKKTASELSRKMDKIKIKTD